MERYFKKIEEHLASLDPETLSRLNDISSERIYPKGSFLLEAGNICRHSFFMLEGTARKYSLHDGKEITTEFYFKDDIAVSFRSYGLQVPSEEFIEAVEDCKVSITDYYQYEALKKKSLQIATLDLIIMEYYALWLEEKLYQQRTMDATERYVSLLNKNTEIIQQMKVGHIASYLGVSFETLSRIRKRLSA